MYKKIILLFNILITSVAFSQTKIEDFIIVDLTQSKDDSYKIYYTNSSWEIGMKRNPIDTYLNQFYNFEIVEEVNFNEKKTLTPSEFDSFILELYYSVNPEKEFDIGRIYATNLKFPNLFIKVSIDDVIKYYKVNFSMTFISI